ncbi:TonB-dependent receptor [Sphingobacterium sp. SRCM116780]|uniref:SusC/RagA family TonB-linked outer membrane protein n=1 Tax=Sphingobacterium sp. SRCM116780 TaxID=2907623 RepID=UPI001F438886|nr:TonB-dependent receptor [Sphingobacterium sp. SRCM116780]UIR56033.1 TonB-dependent receptor [Sphingobacterium sp. SRCM116780]
MIFFTKKATLFIWVTCFLAMISSSFAQGQVQINGRVLDAQDQKPLGGVTIVQKGTTNGVSSKEDGHFQISVPSGSILLLTYVGYETKEVQASQSNLTVQLSASTNVLEDVVVIGYGSVKRKDVTTAISSVSTKDLEKRPIVNVGQAIQGKAAGVAVIQPNGAPGAEMAIRVRGTTSFNGSNDPLYVVDGIPVDNIKFLTPNDITDIQILKDASSAAIYGSRGANGVVLITTKTGKVGEGKITFGAQVTSNIVNNTVEVLNTDQYRDLQNEIGMINLPVGLTDQTDWFKETYKTGVQQNYQLTISDGTEKLRYYLSGGYTYDKGTLKGAFFKKYNFKANIDNQLRKWLKVNANITYSDYNDNGITSGLGSNRGGVVTSVITTPTYAPIWDQTNPDRYYNNFYGINNITSPIENLARTKYNNNRENRLLASGSALITFMPNLNLKSSFSLDRRNGLLTTFLDPLTTAWGRNQYGEASDIRNMNTVLTWDNVLTYNKNFGKHNIEAMAGSSWTDSKYTNSYINGSHYANGIIQTLNAANRIAWDGTGSGGSNWGIMSYFARAMYNYDGKYLITANMRADGSSKLNPNDRWGYFPSVSAAWRLSSEDFMKDLDWINDLKIRGGWGQTGNQSGLGDYSYLAFNGIERIEWFKVGQENAIPNITQPTTLRATDLTWETTTQANVGVDIAAFQNRLTLTLDYYHKKTTNMLMEVTLPAGSAAASVIKRNEGEMTNKGFEITLGSKNLRGNLTWNTDFNISFNKNRLDKLVLSQLYNDAMTNDNVHDYAVRNEPGRALGGFFGYISDGVNPETGQLMYRDLNGDDKISSSDRTYIGDPNPKFTYGMTNNFSWKNFDLSIFIQGTYGNDIFNASRMETEGMYDGRNQTTVVLDRWKVPGQITNVPKAGFDMKNSTYFVEDGSYLRVKNISLGYSIAPERLKHIGIQKIQPYFSASNLLTWTKYSGMDPEVNQYGNSGRVQGIDWGTYPQSRSFVVGVNVEF